MFSGLIFNISTNHFCCNFVSYTPHKIAVTPQLTRPKLLPQSAKFLKYFSPGYALKYLHYFRRRILRRYFHKHVDMIFHHFHGINPKTVLFCYSSKYFLRVLRNLSYQHPLPILRYPNRMIFDIKYCVLRPSYAHNIFIREESPPWQIPSTRLTASRFPPASKLTGIQRSFL